MNILVLHNLEDLTTARESSTDFLFCFQRYAPEHHYHYHRTALPVTKALRDLEFHAVIFTSSALGVVTFRPRPRFHELQERLSFLAASKAVKLFFPQDDYNHSALLDEWFVALNGDAVFTALFDHRRKLYPYATRAMDFFPGLTGYVDDTKLPARRALAKPFSRRTRLIGQRVTMYPARGGRFSRLKGETAEIVKRAALERGLPVDISTDPADVLLGEDWFRFLGDCKFCLGAEGGVSLWDRTGEISDAITQFLHSHPSASFDEIEAACFPDLDGGTVFSAVSPRLFEAATAGCCQILVEGTYLDVLKPYEHYIPLRRDCSNLDEVFELLMDENGAQRRAAAAYAVLVESPRYRSSHLVAQVMAYIRSEAADRSGFESSSEKRFAAFQRNHQDELEVSVASEVREQGFEGMALVQRVCDTLGGQYAEPFVFPDRHSNRLAELYRTALEHRINLIVAIHRRWALEGAFRSVDLATLDRITATALSPGLRGRLLRRVLAWMETHDTTVRLLLGRTTRR